MKTLLGLVKNFVLDILFPIYCLACGREGDYLCQDCVATLEVSEFRYCLCSAPQRVFAAPARPLRYARPKPLHRYAKRCGRGQSRGGKCKKCSPRKLDGLYFAMPYQNRLVRQLIRQFKYEPYVKGLAKALAVLIITHFRLLETSAVDSAVRRPNAVLVPVPVHKKKLRVRGYNHAAEIAKELIQFFQIPMTDCLIKTKKTSPQTELSGQQREQNLKGVFAIKNPERIKNQRIFLIDDVYTTGSTMQECARVLKDAGATEVWGIAVARG